MVEAGVFPVLREGANDGGRAPEPPGGGRWNGHGAKLIGGRIWKPVRQKEQR